MKSICVVCAVAAVALAPGAAATPAEGEVVRTDIATGSGTAVGGVQSTLIVQRLQLKPGASSGWHTHPGPESSVVNSGVVAVQTAGHCGVVEYGSGQAVFIPAGLPHRVANHTTLEADVVVTYTVPQDAPVRGDAADAC